MPIFAPIDWLAAAVFVLSWAGYAWLVDVSRWRDRTLTAAMNKQRRQWMETMLARENRMLDAQVIAGLQSGAAFFASTSLLAIGAAFALLTTSEQVLGVVQDLPFGLQTSRVVWEIKALGLLAIYAYAFFKFGWSVRLFNYASILIGATPPSEQAHTNAAKQAIERATHMSVMAGRHFTRGQRAFFFSVGFLGWFASPWLFLAITLVVLVALCRRQFAFPALDLLR
ncbi:MAG TPA: DUF599 family protein [Propylenella sp.]|nr:DUF599 family protein [Propylenella sp.]